MHRSSIKTKFIFIIISIVTIIFIIIFSPHFFRTTYVVTVTNKRVVNYSNSQKYLIYGQTIDGNMKVFDDYNSFLELKFDSEDIYWGLEVNRRYEIEVYGFNMPFSSSYQNILWVKEVEE
jgi:hypothetical protein